VDGAHGWRLHLRPAILASVKAHTTNASVHEVASGALKNLSVLRDNALSVVSLGGIDALRESLASHPASATLQEVAAARRPSRA
jgi:hypothetical protein